MIQCAGTGLVYRNPKPHLRAVHAWHPSVVALDGEHMLCAFDLGEAVESLDYRTHLSRSDDGGQTWQEPRRLFDDPQPRPTTHTVRLSRMPDGALVGIGARFYRDDPEQGLTNRANMGFVPMDVILLRSDNDGRTWQGPTTIDPPLVGPAFETCHAITHLRDGRWLIPTQTWRGWDGEAPNGMKAIALVSHDRGRSWADYIDVFNGSRNGLIHFEQSLVQLADDRLLAVAWAYEESTGASRPTPFVISRDGQTFSTPGATGLRGQTAKLLALPDGRVLCLYRREDKPGLWANLARLDGDDWVNLAEAPMWQGALTGTTGATNASDRLGTLKLGFPNLTLLPDGQVYAVFWCCEDDVYNIRWLRIVIS